MRLLTAIDLNDHAREVVEEATRWALNLEAALDLAFVDEYQHTAALVPDPQVRLLVEDQWDKVQAIHKAALQELVNALPTPIRGEARYLYGGAAQELVAACDGYDGLILATHGRSGLGHALLGSVAERVLRRSPIPVLVLRLPHDR